MRSVANSGCSFWGVRRSASFATMSAISFPDMPTSPGIQISTVLDGTAEIWFNMSCANGCGLFVLFLELSKRRADKESDSMQFPLSGDFVIALTAVCMARSSAVKTWVNAVSRRFSSTVLFLITTQPVDVVFAPSVKYRSQSWYCWSSSARWRW